METDKKPKFRIRIEDLENRKHRMITIYTKKQIKLDNFRTKLIQKIKEIK